jgi:hypothetical protein
MLGLRNAPVAQLDRAAASEAVGQKFESSRAHHFFLLFSGKILAGGAVRSDGLFGLFLRGVFEKQGCRTWFFDGLNVVECW